MLTLVAKYLKFWHLWVDSCWPDYLRLQEFPRNFRNLQKFTRLYRVFQPFPACHVFFFLTCRCRWSGQWPIVRGLAPTNLASRCGHRIREGDLVAVSFGADILWSYLNVILYVLSLLYIYICDYKCIYIYISIYLIQYIIDTTLLDPAFFEV